MRGLHWQGDLNTWSRLWQRRPQGPSRRCQRKRQPAFPRSARGCAFGFRTWSCWFCRLTQTSSQDCAKTRVRLLRLRPGECKKGWCERPPCRFCRLGRSRIWVKVLQLEDELQLGLEGGEVDLEQPVDELLQVQARVPVLVHHREHTLAHDTRKVCVLTSSSYLKERVFVDEFIRFCFRRFC